MKVKYFIRGLGIGILVTALLLCAGTRKNQNKGLTDKEIMQRAKELGMMTKEEAEDYKLDSNLDSIKDSLAASQSPEPSEHKQSDNKDKQESAEPSKETPAVPSKEPEKDADSEKQENTISVTIESGMDSQSIARHLYQKHVIGSASDFDAYMLEHDVTQKLKAGDFEIPANASYAEIVKIIT